MSRCRDEWKGSVSAQSSSESGHARDKAETTEQKSAAEKKPPWRETEEAA